MTLPIGTFVRHLNGNARDSQQRNLRLVHGQQKRPARPAMALVTEIDRHKVFLHDLNDLITEGLIADGHPNARLDNRQG